MDIKTINEHWSHGPSMKAVHSPRLKPEVIQAELDLAIKREEYEYAAVLRDRLARYVKIDLKPEDFVNLDF